MNPFRRKADHVQSVVLDTSGIIDGRIVEIARAGFVPQNVVVPQFVIAELQFLADHGDTHKRERARYGLDVIRELQDVRRVEVSISREKFEHIREVDDKLVALAKQYGALLYTTDFNLNKVAQIEGVHVLNVNELAHALRPNLLPGELVVIKLTQVGQDKTQGVGYLDDGTMVVVEQASRYVGQQVQAICTRILQTQAGKMMFAKLAAVPATQPAQPKAQELPRKDHKPQVEQRPQRQPQPAAPQQPAAGGSHSKRRRGNRGTQGQGRPSTPQTTAQSQSQPDQRQNRHGSESGPKRPTSSASAQANTAAKQSQSRRPASNKRRLSPEDSLLATLKEIDTQ